MDLPDTSGTFWRNTILSIDEADGGGRVSRVGVAIAAHGGSLGVARGRRSASGRGRRGVSLALLAVELPDRASAASSQGAERRGAPLAHLGAGQPVSARGRHEGHGGRPRREDVMSFFGRAVVREISRGRRGGGRGLRRRVDDLLEERREKIVRIGRTWHEDGAMRLGSTRGAFGSYHLPRCSRCLVDRRRDGVAEG